MSTGELGTWIKEQSLIVDSDKGSIIITGCAHPGIVKIIQKAKEMGKKEIIFVMGGFHLGGESENTINNIITDFKKLGVKKVGPCHCTGEQARQLFKKEYGENYLDVGVGRIIKLENLSEN